MGGEKDVNEYLLIKYRKKEGGKKFMNEKVSETNLKDPDTIIIDNKANIIALEREGTVLEVFEYYAHKLKGEMESNPNHAMRIDIGTGYFFFSGFEEAYDTFKFMYDDGLLEKVKNPNWWTEAPIRVVMGRETDRQTKELLLSIVKDRLSSYDDEKIELLRRLVKEGLIEFRVFEDRKFHVKIYNFYFTDPESYAEPIDVYAGSANFTASGLRSNIEICLPYRGSSSSRALFRDWFTNLWNISNPDLDVLEVINSIGESNYVLLIPEVFFAKLINLLGKRYLFPTRVGVETDILLEFQNLSYYIVMERLQKYGGYILANSVGLGKSYVACQVMNEYLMNLPDKKCLLVYPPRIKEEWGEYLEAFNIKDRVDILSMEILQKAPFEKREDEELFFDYRRYAERYSLIVVDEAHNFRNPCNRSTNLKEIIKTNPKADVLLVSATPINLGASDLINLIDLFYMGEKQRKFEIAGLKKVYDQTKKRILKNRVRELDEELLENLKRIEVELLLKITWRIVQEFFREDLRRLSGREVRYEEPDTKEVRFDYPDIYKREIFEEIVGFLEFLNYEPAKLWDGEEYKEDKSLLAWYKWQLYKRLESSLYAFYKSIANLYRRFILYRASMEQERVIDSGYLDGLPINISKAVFDEIIDLERVGAVVYTYKSLDNSLKEEIVERLDCDIRTIEKMLKKLKEILGEMDDDGNLKCYP
ncbi:MAG: DNA/RNA helicase, superfamily II, partial [Candidatus Hydrothermarchaeota archaeon]